MLKPLQQLGKTYRHIGRYREIISVLVKYGFGDMVVSMNLERFLPSKPPGFAFDPKTSRWKRIRLTLEELGPTSIKLGQMITNQPALFPEELVTELEKLQDNAPPFPGDVASRVIEEELGAEIHQVFATFMEEPIASGSIGQVHLGTLQDGSKVAIKVKRPGIDERVKTDLEILYDLARLATRYIDAVAAVKPEKILLEFEKTIHEELNFVKEGTNQERFGRNFNRETRIHVPKLYRQWSGQKVLTMEYIDGIKVSQIEKLQATGMDTKTIAENGSKLILRQIFQHGFFHADPHPGNLFILPNHVVCFLDYGMMGSLTLTQREQLGNLIVGVVRNDEAKISRSILQFTHTRIANREAFQNDIGNLLNQYATVPIRDIHVGDILNQLAKIISIHRLNMPPGFYLLVKTLISVEGLGSRLNPEFDMVLHMRPFAKAILKRKLNPTRVMQELYLNSGELLPDLMEIPVEALDSMRHIRNGELKIQFEHTGLAPVLKQSDRLVNRLAFAIVLASLLIGSSIVTHARIPPLWNGLPLIGLLGFLSAGMIGFWLLVSILRQGKM